MSVVLILALLIILIKNEYARLLLRNANYGLEALVTRSAAMETTPDHGPDMMTDNAGSKSSDGIRLFIGSSMFRRGLDIQALDEQLEGDNELLTHNGTRPFQTYAEWQYLQKRGVKVKALYVDLYVYSLQVDPWVEDERLFLESDLPFKWQLWQQMKAYSQNPVKDFWTMFVTANNERLLTWFIDYPITNRMFERGGMIMSDGPEQTLAQTARDMGVTLEEPSAEIAATPDFNGAKLNEAQVGYVRALIEDCRERQIPLYFVETPKFASIMRQSEYVELMRAYLEILEDAGAQYYLTEESAKHVLFNQENMNGLAGILNFDTEDPELFADWVHLTGHGAGIYSTEFAKAAAATEALAGTK